MPAIAYEIATTSSDTTTTGTSYTAVTGASVTLTAGRWLILCNCAFRHEEGIGSATGAAEVEARHNSTRIAVGRWGTAFGQFNTGDAAAGGLLQFHAVIDAANSDTVALYLRREDGTAGTTVRAGHATIIAINLDDLVEGEDYWFADSASGNTAETSITGTTFVEGDVDGQLEVTIPSNGDYLWISSCEGVSSTYTTASEGFQARWRIDGSDSGIEVTQVFTASETSPLLWPNFCVIDVRNYATNDTPRAEWEFANLITSTVLQFRRTRTFLLRLGALRDYEFITNGGGVQASGGSDVEATNGVTFNFGSTDALVLGAAAAEAGTSDWGDAELHRDAGDVDYPDGGYLQTVWVSGDIGGFFFLHALAVTGSETFRLVQRTDASATTYTLGRNAANSGDARTPIIALDLYVPDPSGAFDGTCTATVALAAAFTGVGNFTASCTATTSLAAVFTGVGNFTTSCTASVALAATFTGVGNFTASCTATTALAATFTGPGAVAGTSNVSVALAATFGGPGAVGGTCTAAVALASTFTGIGALTGQLAVSIALAADFTGEGGGVADVEGSCVATVAFSATFTGVGAFAGAMTVSSQFRWHTPSPISGETTMSIRTTTRTMTIAPSVREMRINADNG